MSVDLNPGEVWQYGTISGCEHKHREVEGTSLVFKDAYHRLGRPLLKDGTPSSRFCPQCRRRRRTEATFIRRVAA